LAFFGMALSTAAFPRIADNVADGDLETVRVTIARVFRAIMFLTIPASLGLAILAEPVTAMLLQRGEFTAFDTEVTAGALMFYSLGIIPQAGIEIHSRAFYAVGDTRTPVIFAVLAMFVNLVIAAMVWDVWEADGLALAVSTAAWIEWVLLYIFYVRRLDAAPLAGLAAISRFAFCGATMALFLALAFAAFDPEGVVDQGAIAICGALAGAAVYAGMARWLKVNELEEATQQLRRGWRRGDVETDPERQDATAISESEQGTLNI
ncbi:MAG: lipid II flippase MurJ, partial [Dehalococcoidia bacterium]